MLSLYSKLLLFGILLVFVGVLLSVTLDAGTSRAEAAIAAPPLAPNATPTPTCGPTTWTTQAVYPTVVRHSAVAVVGGLLYSFGGSTDAATLANAYVYDPGTDTWTAIAPLPAVRAGASAVSDGTFIYILNGTGPGGTITNTLYRYNPATNTYTTLPAAPNVSVTHGAALLSGKIYRVGGCSPTCLTFSASVDVYDIATNAWAAAGSVAAYPIGATELAVVSDGTYLYGAGGIMGGGTTTAKTYRYDPVSNSWNDAAITDLPQGRASVPHGVLSGRFLLAGGDIGSTTNTVISLDLSAPAGAWAAQPTMPDSRRRGMGATLGVTFYVIGGYAPTGVLNNTVYRFVDFACPTPTVTNTPTRTNTPAATNTPTRTNTPISTPTPLPCGNLWTTQAPYPTAISSLATTAQNGIIYSFGGIVGSDTNAANRYDPTTNAWTPIASLPAFRSGASAVSDGTYIYILGGTSGGFHQNTFYRYDPVANSYSTMAVIPRIVTWASAAYLNGKIYLIGGCNPGNCSFGIAQVDIYTVATNTWASGPAYPIGISYANAMVLGGFIYVAGGKDGTGQATSKAYRLDPTTNLWDDASIADLPAARQEVAGDLLNGRWILAGGRDALGSLVGAVAWDPVSNIWSTVSGMPTPAFAPGAATVAGAFYVVGGDAFGRTNLLRRYTEGPACTATPTPTATLTNTPTRTNTPTNTATITFTRTATNTATPTVTLTATSTATAFTPLPTATCGPTTWAAVADYPSTIRNPAVTAQGGLLYSFGGNTGSGGTANAYLYNPAINLWAAIAPLPAIKDGASAVSDGTYIYILNGFGPGGSTTDSLYRYNPATNSYTTLAIAPRPSSLHGSALLGGKIYRVGGCVPNCAIIANTVDAYDIASNTWAAMGSIASYPMAIFEMALGTDGTFLYGAGGGNASAIETNKTYRFDPVGNAWNDAAITDLPQARMSHASAVHNGRLWLAGGTTPGVTSSVVALDLAAPTGVWASQPSLPAAHYRGAGVGAAGTIFVVAGNNSSAQATTAVYRFYDNPCPVTATPTFSNTPTPSNTPTRTLTSTPTLTNTPTRTPTLTNTPTSTSTLTNTPSNTPTSTSTNTATPYPTCFVNVAQGKPASQSSTAFGAPADRAVDGNTDGNWSNNSVTHTDTESQPWWQVDLGLVMQVATVDLWNRTDCCSERLSNFDLSWSEDGTTWSSTYFPGIAPTRTTFAVNAQARYVKVQLRGTNPLSLAEVQVWVCDPPTPTATNTPTHTPTNTATAVPTQTATPTNTSTATSTNTPAPAGVIVGHLTWQGITQPNSRNDGVTATLSLCVGGVAQNYNVTTDASGYLTVTTGLPDGSYNWRLKGALNLANSGSLSMAGGLANQEMGMMRAGDSTNDNNVSVVDFNTLKNTFGKTLGDVGYDPRADFNRDNSVSVLDFNNQKNNFGQSGATLTCP